MIFFKKKLKDFFYCYFMTTIDNVFLAKTSGQFCCDYCNYTTIRKYNFNLHIESNKHKNNANNNENNVYLAKTSKTYNCNSCNKFFHDRAGLWRHKKKCGLNNQTENHKSILDKDELIITLLKQNAELLEIVKNGTHINNTTNNNTNSHNKAFNLNFFLNETCKNAMNITDFVDSIKLQLTDFMDVGEIGFVQGISNIIVKKLNDLDETIRPIHCTDQKRETFYVKDEDKWEKEEEDMKKIRKMINKIAYKNEKLMVTYKKEFPDYNDYDSKRSDQYSKFVIEAMGGKGENNKEKENKIIKHISKATTIHCK